MPKNTPTQQHQANVFMSIGVTFLAVGTVFLVIEPTRIASLPFFVLGLVFLGQGYTAKTQSRKK